MIGSAIWKNVAQQPMRSFERRLTCLLSILQLLFLADCNKPVEVARPNRLAAADSPYLREHADNPVQWHEWGREALEKAKAENKPLIISIGYASCHWCHVMEEESFMDTSVARLMNEHFVPIKVDREQRPDIDQIYLNAAELISGQAGWPLNAFALPDGRPFYAGTYFPKEQWMTLLRQINDTYREEYALIARQAEALTSGVQAHDLITTPGDSAAEVNKNRYAGVFDQWAPGLDFENGGLAGAPKFPMPASWEFVLQYHALTGDQKALGVVMTTLDRMAAGGIYDHLGGGFFRYSTDDAWRIPHFEKMLYDNAQLATLYAHAYRLTKKPLYRRIVVETLAFVEKELADETGGFFYSSLNADTEGEEGKFYVWKVEEFNDILGRGTAGLISQWYHATDSGNWEDRKNVLYTTEVSGDFARKNQLTEQEWEKLRMTAQQDLLAFRDGRIRPSRDEKVLTSWNALMLISFAEAFVATGDPHYLDLALKNAAFLEKTMIQPDGSVWRNYKDGKATIAGFLDDYALLAQAFVQLYQVTFDVRWLVKARAVADFAIRHFKDDKSGLFYYTSDRSEDLVARKMELADNVIPSSNSVLAGVLFHLGELYQQPSYTDQGRIMVDQILRNREGSETLFYANWLRQAAWYAYQPYEVAVLGDRAREVNAALQKDYFPLAIFLGGEQEHLPLLENKYVEGKTIIYVCRNRICRLPVEDVASAREQLK